MTQAVADVVAAIRAAVAAAYPVDAVPIVGNVGPTDPPQRATVLVGSASVEPPSVACPSGRTYAVTVWAISAVTAPGAGDTDLDRLLDVALDGLDAAGIVWTQAVRGTWYDAYPSYEITTEVVG
jgi:hypothetical protein